MRRVENNHVCFKRMSGIEGEVPRGYSLNSYTRELCYQLVAKPKY